MCWTRNKIKFYFLIEIKCYFACRKIDRNKYLQFKIIINGSIQCQLPFISRTRPTFKQLEQAVQYTYRLHKAKRDGTPNESVPSREIQVKKVWSEKHVIKMKLVFFMI